MQSPVVSKRSAAFSSVHAAKRFCGGKGTESDPVVVVSDDEGDNEVLCTVLKSRSISAVSSVLFGGASAPVAAVVVPVVASQKKRWAMQATSDLIDNKGRNLTGKSAGGGDAPPKWLPTEAHAAKASSMATSRWTRKASDKTDEYATGLLGDIQKFEDKMERERPHNYCMAGKTMANFGYTHFSLHVKALPHELNLILDYKRDKVPKPVAIEVIRSVANLIYQSKDQFRHERVNFNFPTFNCFAEKGSLIASLDSSPIFEHQSKLRPSTTYCIKGDHRDINARFLLFEGTEHWDQWRAQKATVQPEVYNYSFKSVNANIQLSDCIYLLTDPWKLNKDSKGDLFSYQFSHYDPDLMRLVGCAAVPFNPPESAAGLRVPGPGEDIQGRRLKDVPMLTSKKVFLIKWGSIVSETGYEGDYATTDCRECDFNAGLEFYIVVDNAGGNLM